MRFPPLRRFICVFAFLTFAGLATGAIAQTQPTNPPEEKEVAPTAAQLRSLANLRLLQKAIKLRDAFGTALETAGPPGETSEARANRAIDTLLKEAGLIVADLNQARVRTAASAAKMDSPPVSLETIVLTSIAHFAFTRKDTAIIAAADKRGIDFSQNDLAALRARQTGKPPLEIARLLTDAVQATPSLIKESQLTEGTDDLLVSRIASRRLKEAETGKTNLSPEAKDALRSLSLSHPTAAPTPPTQQGKTGRYDRASGKYYAPAPDRLPTLAPGQKFLCDQEGKITLRDSRTNQTIPRKNAVFRILTLHKVERSGENEAGEILRLTFALEGYPVPVFWSGVGGLYELPGIRPLADDDNVRFLRGKYEGKTVWSYEGLRVSVVTEDGNGAGFGYNAETPAVVKRIYRIRGGYPQSLPIGSAPNPQDDRHSIVQTNDPLFVELQIAPDAKPTGGSWTGNLDRNKNGVIFPSALAYYDEFADIWDFERRFTLIGLPQISKRWPAVLRRAALANRLAKGMTPEMAAFVSGWPNEYGTRAELIKRATNAAKATWEYDSAPPFHFYLFFKNGSVTHWGNDIELH